MSSSVFWDMTQCTQEKANRRFGGKYRLPALPVLSMPIYFLAYTSFLDIEAISSPETSIDILGSARRYILKDKTFQMT
jgi:hypothetical protein